MGFVSNHDDVVAVRKHWEHVLVFAGHELLDGGEHDATGGPVAQQLAQRLPGGCLHGLLAQQVLRQAEHPKELAIQVVAVGDDDDGWVGHGGFLHHAGGKAGHGDALAAALRVPHHTALTFLVGCTVGARCGHHMTNGCSHRVVLVVARHLLYQAAVILEQDEVAQVVQQHLRVEHAVHQGLQLVELTQWVQVHAVDGSPLQKAFGAGRQAPHAGIRSV